MLIIFYESVSYLPQLDDKQLEGEGNVTGLLPSPPLQGLRTAGNQRWLLVQKNRLGQMHVCLVLVSARAKDTKE